MNRRRDYNYEKAQERGHVCGRHSGHRASLPSLRRENQLAPRQVALQQEMRRDVVEGGQLLLHVLQERLRALRFGFLPRIHIPLYMIAITWHNKNNNSRL